MPRSKKIRKMVAPPSWSQYKPVGGCMGSHEPVDLLYEEYEAIKLADYRHMNHQEASILMGVSRSTFARIYKSARCKIAQVLAEGREMHAVYGNTTFSIGWWQCQDCATNYTLTKNKNVKDIYSCPLCKSNNIKEYK